MGGQQWDTAPGALIALVVRDGAEAGGAGGSCRGERSSSAAEWCLFGLGSFSVTAQDWKGCSHSIWNLQRTEAETLRAEGQGRAYCNRKVALGTPSREGNGDHSQH